MTHWIWINCGCCAGIQWGGEYRAIARASRSFLAWFGGTGGRWNVALLRYDGKPVRFYSVHDTEKEAVDAASILNDRAAIAEYERRVKR